MKSEREKSTAHCRRTKKEGKRRGKLEIQYSGKSGGAREEQWMGFHANCQLVMTIKLTDGYLSYLSHSSLPSAFYAHAQSGIKKIQLENYCNTIFR